jgi:hypothetical protein
MERIAMIVFGAVGFCFAVWAMRKLGSKNGVVMPRSSISCPGCVCPDSSCDSCQHRQYWHTKKLSTNERINNWIWGIDDSHMEYSNR